MEKFVLDFLNTKISKLFCGINPNGKGAVSKTVVVTRWGFESLIPRRLNRIRTYRYMYDYETARRQLHGTGVENFVDWR